MSRPKWCDRPHEIREDVNDGSMCRCGLPIDDNHDRVLAEDAQAAEKVALTDADREALAVVIGSCNPHTRHVYVDGNDACLIAADAVLASDWLAARVAEAVDRERAAWAAKIETIALSLDRGDSIDRGIASDLRALLSADGTEVERGALRDVLAERWTQVAKGYTPEHDDEHPLGQLLGYGGLQWHPVTHSPQDRAKIRAEMIRAGACLLAGIEWIDRRLAADDTEAKP